MQLFNRPTVISITAPTCSGKNFFLEKMFSALQNFNIQQAVTTTSRATRPGEVDGVHYFFRTREQFLQEQKEGRFVETNEFLGNYYGLSCDSLEKLLEEGKTPVCILDINGVDSLHEYCLENEIQHFSVFIKTPVEIRIQRLNNRALAALDEGKDPKAILLEHTRRVDWTITKEESWRTDFAWSVVVPGTDANVALKQMLDTIKQINKEFA